MDKGSSAFLGSFPFSLWGWMVNSSFPFPMPVPGCFSCASLGMVAQLYFRMVTDVSALRTLGQDWLWLCSHPVQPSMWGCPLGAELCCLA